MTNTPTQTRKPDLFIYTKISGDRNGRIGSRIGAGFFHGTGEGINIILDAQPIPLNGRIELVGFPLKEEPNQ